MKLCDKCGAYNSDERFFCVDCNEKLGEKASKQLENTLENDITQKTEKLYSQKDPLFVGKLDRFTGAWSIIGLLAALFVGFTCGLYYFVYMAILFAVPLADSFFPSLFWELSRLKLSFMVDNCADASPSELYLTWRRISNLILCIMGTALAAALIYSKYFLPRK